jgi:protein-L-isoaspartate(D-aspartate) O-methyltransferase
MTDFAAARRMMVDGQVRTSDVTDLRLISAMLEIPREKFVPAANADLAYLDLDLPVTGAGEAGAARALLKPMVLAKMIQAAAVRDTDHVLDVGCATGYSSAVLARLAHSVVALEEDAALARFAADALAAAGARNVTVVTGPLTEGRTASAPYDVIFLDGTVEVVPQTLRRQLKDGGRLLAIMGGHPPGRAMLYRSTGGEGWPLFDAAAAPLPGFAKPREFVF